MREYETVAILRPDVTDSYVNTLTKKIEKVVAKKPGQIKKKDDWGLKKLAYPIKHQAKGRYLFWSYQNEPVVVENVEKSLRYDENVIRFMTVFVEPESQSRKAVKARANNSDEKGKGPRRRRFGERRLDNVSYRDPITLAKYISEKGKIVPRRTTGITAGSQRKLAREIKRARQIALMSYTDSFSFSSGASSHYYEERGDRS